VAAFLIEIEPGSYSYADLVRDKGTAPEHAS
jgi:hypothetical protein